MSQNKTYIAIDLKSFYASVECVERHLDPLTTNLVVADMSRTEKTICLAVSPSLKEYGLSGRSRLYEVIQKVDAINQKRLRKSGLKEFTKSSYNQLDLAQNRQLKLDYLVATPQMAKYMERSAEIYSIYLKYVAPEDIHVYSIDEVFIDATPYLNTYKMTAHQFAMTMIQDVLHTTGITATAGIGPNLYLCKVAMDIWAKHQQADADGVRIAELDIKSYRHYLWDHRPITDFWRVGRGYKKRLEKYHLYTMGDIARYSLAHEDELFKEFGVNAELLIDHAWGYESCTMPAIKAYKPSNNSLGAGQVLPEPYDFYKGRIVMQEMSEALSLDLVAKGLVTNQIVISIGYDISNINDSYTGEIKTDFYGRNVPKSAHGSQNLERFTASTKLINEATLKLYDRIVKKHLLIRRLSITAAHVVPFGSDEAKIDHYEQLNLFTVDPHQEAKDEKLDQELQEEKELQETLIKIKGKFGKNSVLKLSSYQEGATARERNEQIGGHKA